MHSKTIVAGLLLVLAVNIGAEEPQAGSPNWDLLVQREARPTIKPFFCAYLTANSQKFAFFVPQDLTVFNEGPKIKFLNPDGNCVMSLTILGAVPESGELNTDVCREWLLAKRAGAKVVSQFTRTAAGRYGPGYDIQWTGANDIVQCQRTVYVPSPVGVLEFSATGTRSNFPLLTANLDSVLATFRAAKDGKLEVVHLSPNS